MSANFLLLSVQFPFLDVVSNLILIVCACQRLHGEASRCLGIADRWWLIMHRGAHPGSHHKVGSPAAKSSSNSEDIGKTITPLQSEELPPMPTIISPSSLQHTTVCHAPTSTPVWSCLPASALVVTPAL